MKRTLKNLTFISLIALTMAMTISVDAQSRAYRVSDRQVQSLLDRLETETDTFKTEIDRSLDRSNIDGTGREDSINTMVANFEEATNRLRDNFAARRSASADVQEVLDRAVSVNRFMRNSRMSRTAQNLWTLVRNDLNTLAGYYRVTATWNDTVTTGTTTGVYTGTAAQMRTLLNRLKLRSSAFRQSYDRWSNQFDRPTNPSASYDISQSLTEYEGALNNLSGYSNRNSSNVEDVLRPAAAINRFVASNRTNRSVTSNWNLVRADLDTLAGYYRVSWNWDNTITPAPVDPPRGLAGRLTGTYRLNTAQSDNVTTIVDRSLTNSDPNRTDRARRMLERRLMSPDALAFEMRGQEVTMSAANGQSVTLTANGTAQTETSPNGRTVTTTVTTTNGDLTINYEGDRMNDYFVNFVPQRNGQLKVTRRVYLENDNQTVTAVSVYDKTSQTPQWNTAGYPSGTPVGQNVNAFLIPNDTRITATLDTPLSTQTAQNGDRFSMTVTSPSQYNGAVIEGTVSGERSGVVSGRANLSLNFATIRTRGGRTYSFAGIVDGVRNSNGDTVNVNNEGAIRDNSQTNKTVTRAGIGALLGGIIGAIAGGGSGAAIGAGVGAGAGAGTVILQGRDNLELATGTQFSITATAPAYAGNR